jgi:hypothetical protein
MSTKSNSPEPKESGEKKKKSKLVWLLLLLLLILFGVQWKLAQYKKQALADEAQKKAELAEQARKDSLARLDSLKSIEDSLKALQDSAALKDSLLQDSLLQDSLQRDSVMQDSIRKALQDASKGTSLEARSSELQASSQSASGDTLAPAPYLDPPPGRYFGKVEVSIRCPEKNCTVYRREGGQEQESSGPISLKASEKIEYLAQDSAGNRSAPIIGEYEVVAGSHKCGAGMMPIPVQGGESCMDIYEYPNKKGSLPKAFISHEEAVKTCSEAGKRLCTVDEWQSACKGKGSRYPYGDSYNPHKCYSVGGEAGRSGRKSQCRSYYGIYDLSGNVWEWTGTPYSKRDGFFLVAGGSWKTQNRSACNETKFSFYPQNQYPFVGFRCCK